MEEKKTKKRKAIVDKASSMLTVKRYSASVAMGDMQLKLRQLLGLTDVVFDKDHFRSRYMCVIVYNRKKMHAHAKVQGHHRLDRARVLPQQRTRR